MGEPIQFSEREKQVIALLIQGRSNKQIALALGVSLRTVEFHLSKMYAKLGVTSRTEAALRLQQADLRESAGEGLRESTVPEVEESSDNQGASISRRRIPMNKSSLIGLSIIALTAALCVGSLFMAVERSASEDATTKPTRTHPATRTVPTDISVASSREHIIEQVRQLAAEYDQAVQAEKQHGEVEFGTDPDTGEEIFLFKGESERRITTLAMKLDEEISQLQQLYNRVYWDETNPTPFPTASSPEQAQAYYQQLMEQSSEYCPKQELTRENATVMVYDPAEGKYYPRIINEETARCDIYMEMIEEWRTAPKLAKVDQDADMTLIRQIMGKPDLKLTFQSVSGVPNAMGRSAALYVDETARLAAIEPNFPGHPNIASADAKSMDELRGIARQFAATNSPRLAELESVLLYEENCKVQICFFRWDYRNKDWTGTDWAMMPPFLQVGVLANGQIVTYNNTLDLVAK